MNPANDSAYMKANKDELYQHSTAIQFLCKLLSPVNADANAFGRVCLCVRVSACMSLCLLRALTFESLGIETSFWRAGTSSEYLGQVRISRSLG